MESEMPPGAQGWTMQPGPRDQSKELEPLLREGGMVDWADAYLSTMGRAHALDSYRPGFESQPYTY